ncbi:anti-sigma factor family protein [Gracilimonas halophila]|uniref:Anti-sigma factor family protein n=1 Tax=Gracilimonas halophila TaxID=1834464 RepID=A0ABW5JFN7_9BACT
MNKETARSLFMDYLYGELEQDQRKELEIFLSQDPELQKELDELGDVRSMLQHLPVQDPAEQLVMVEPNKSGFQDWWNELIESWIPTNGFARAGFAMASVLILFVVVGAFTKMNISVDNGGFNLTFGEKQEIIQQGFTPQQVEMLLQQVREDNAVMISDAIQQAQQQQENRIEKTLVNFADYIEQQRQSDLQMISSGIYNMEETYYDRFRQTDQVLGELIQTVSTRN